MHGTYRTLLQREDGIADLFVVIDEDRCSSLLNGTEIRALMILKTDVAIDELIGLLLGDAAVGGGRESRRGKGESRGNNGEFHLDVQIM